MKINTFLFLALIATILSVGSAKGQISEQKRVISEQLEGKKTKQRPGTVGVVVPIVKPIVSIQKYPIGQTWKTNFKTTGGSNSSDMVILSFDSKTGIYKIKVSGGFSPDITGSGGSGGGSGESDYTESQLEKILADEGYLSTEENRNRKVKGELAYNVIDSYSSKFRLFFNPSQRQLQLFKITKPATQGREGEMNNDEQKVMIWSVDTKDADRLIMQKDGNLVAYAGNKPTWATGTNKVNSSENVNAYLMLHRDGNLVMYNEMKLQIWQSGTAGK